MKNFIIFAAMLLGSITFKKVNAQNRSDGGAPISFSGATPPQFTNEIFRFRPGLATHYFAGALPSGGAVGFGSNDQWLSHGQVTGAAQTL